VARVLYSHGPSTLEELIKYSKTEKITEEVARDCLGILIHHRLASFTAPDKNFEIDIVKLLTNKAVLLPQKHIMYELEFDNIILRLEFPRFIQLIETEFSPKEAHIVSILCLHGRLQQHQLESEFSIRYQKTYFAGSFSVLVNNGFICKARPIEFSNLICKTEAFTDYFWQLDFDHFLQVFRERDCIKFVEERTNIFGGKIAEALIKMHSSDQTGAAIETAFRTETEIIDSSGLVKLERSEFKRGLDLMLNESLVIPAADDFRFALNLTHIILTQKQRYLEMIIKKTSGDAALRIFRMLSANAQMEQDRKIMRQVKLFFCGELNSHQQCNLQKN